MTEDAQPAGELVQGETEEQRLQAVLVEIGQPSPLPSGCACWAEVASFYQEDLARRIELARAALPDALRPAERPLYQIEVVWE